MMIAVRAASRYCFKAMYRRNKYFASCCWIKEENVLKVNQNTDIHNTPIIFVSSKRKASRCTKLCFYFNFYPPYNTWKEHNRRVGVLRMAFRARKFFGTFEKRPFVEYAFRSFFLFSVWLYNKFTLGIPSASPMRKSINWWVSISSEAWPTWKHSNKDKNSLWLHVAYCFIN